MGALQASLILLMLASESFGKAECPPCDITLQPVVRIGSINDPVARSMEGDVARLSNGNFVLAPMFGVPQLALYGPDGSFLRLYDRRGNGPGELNTFALRLDVGRNDTLLVWTQGRLLKFTPELVPAHTEVWSSTARSIAVLPDGRVVGNFQVRDGDRRLLTHVISGGSVVTSFDAALPTEASADHNRIYAAAEGGAVWAGRTNELRFTLHDRSGRVVRQIRAEVDWFPRWTTRPEGAPFRARPQPFVSGISMLDSERLLVLVTTADAGWRRVREDVATPSTNLDHVYDTVILIVDARNGTVLGSRRSDERLRLVKGAPGLVYAPVETELGDIIINLSRVRLAER
jgi:hypothetical protein